MNVLYKVRFELFRSVDIKLTSKRDKALKSALYSMLTSALPPPVDLYEYFEVLATLDDIIDD